MYVCSYVHACMYIYIEFLECNHYRLANYMQFSFTLTLLFNILVPTPTVNVTAPNTQTVGQSITLQCEVTNVRGITSRVDIVWSSDDTVLRRMNNTTATMGNPLVYTDSYDITLLSTNHDGAVYECEAVINSSPSATATDNITLDVIGEY